MNERIALNAAPRRLGRLAERISALGIDALLITSEVNVRYLTGFTGDSSYLLVKPGEASSGGTTILSDPRYDEQLAEECPEISKSLRESSQSIVQFTAKRANELGIRQLGVEAADVTLGLASGLRRAAPDIELIETVGEVENLRAIKESTEIAAIRRAVDVAQRVFQSLAPRLRANWTELEISYEIERLIRELGGSGCSFDPIVAAGPRAALPHARPQASPLGDASHLLIDWGATVDGYRSDLTRVLLTSRIPAEISRGYEAVLASQEAAILAMRPGVSVGEIDAVARDVLGQFGVADYFTHGLGHSIGLDIHEAPFLREGLDTPLETGMVVTVEPGVYYPGIGGIRIEDDVLVTDDGCEVLSSLPKQLDPCGLSLLS